MVLIYLYMYSIFKFKIKGCAYSKILILVLFYFGIMGADHRIINVIISAQYIIARPIENHLHVQITIV